MAGLLLALNPYIDRFTSGVGTGYLDAANMTSLTLTQPDPDTVTRTSYLASTYGQALDSAQIPKPVEIEFTLDEMHPDILSMGMLGRPADYSQAAGADQTITIAALQGKWVAIGKNNLTAFAITGKTEGTDYEVSMDGGLFKSLTIADGEVTATASWSARAGKTIVAGTDTLLQISMHGFGVNRFNGEQVEFDIFQANVSPSGGLSLIGNEPVSITLKGTLITPTGKSGPYQIKLHSAAS